MAELDARTRNLLAAARRQDASVEGFALTLDEEPITFSESGLARVHCVVCGAPDVNVHPRFIRAARCSRCIREGAVVPDPDPDDRPLSTTFEALKAPYEPPKPSEPERPVAPEWTTRSIGPIPPPPAAVTGLLKSAEEMGWTGEITYARGKAPKDRAVKDSFAVRLTKGELRAVAVYSGGSWDAYWGVAHLLELPNKEEFKAYLKVAGSDLAEGFVRRVREAVAVEAAKEKPVKCRDVLPHLDHRWMNSKGFLKLCPGVPCDVLNKHDAHMTEVMIGKKRESRSCPGRVRQGVARKTEKDNGG